MGSVRIGPLCPGLVPDSDFFSIGSCLACFAYSSLAKRSDRRAAVAGAVVAAEAIVYALNGLRCPLTDLAERLESERGSVADIYLPRWIEAHLPEITGRIFAGATILHARNVLESRRLAETLATNGPPQQGGRSHEPSRCPGCGYRPAVPRSRDRPSREASSGHQVAEWHALDRREHARDSRECSTADDRSRWSRPRPPPARGSPRPGMPSGSAAALVVGNG